MKVKQLEHSDSSPLHPTESLDPNPNGTAGNVYNTAEF